MVKLICCFGMNGNGIEHYAFISLFVKRHPLKFKLLISRDFQFKPSIRIGISFNIKNTYTNAIQ